MKNTCIGYSTRYVTPLIILLIIAASFTKATSHDGMMEIANYEAMQDSTEKQKLLDRVRNSRSGSIHVWVYYEMEHYDPSMAQIYRGEIAQRHSEFMSKIQVLNVRSVKPMAATPRVSLIADERALKKLFEMDMVEKVTEMRIFRSFLSESISLVRADFSWGDFDVTGEDQVIVIIDSGIDFNHEFLNNKVIKGACFSTHDPLSDYYSLCENNAEEDTTSENAGRECVGLDGCDHGSHVAGIAAGNGQSFSGVAKNAELISIQVFTKIEDEKKCEELHGEESKTPCLGITEDNLELALQWVYNNINNYNVTTINLSFGSGSYQTECDDDNLNPIFESLKNNNIVSVAASGNNGLENAIASPACIPSVISVGATDKNDIHWAGDEPDEGSNFGEILDLVAPGVAINSSVPDDQYASFTGTSMAAPHVAGAVALIKEANPNFDHATVKNNILNNTFYKELDWADSLQYGQGRLDAYESVLKALELNPKSVFFNYNEVISNITYEGRNLYLLKDQNVYFEDDVFLTMDTGGEPSIFRINGNLQGDGRICLNDGSEYFLGPNGSISNFGGSFEINCPDIPEYPTVSDTTFTQSTVLADTLMLAGVTTLDPGVTVTVAENNLVIVADTLQMNGSGQATSEIASEGELRLSEAIKTFGGRLVSMPGGNIYVESNSFLHSTRFRVETAGSAFIHPNVTMNKNMAAMVINGTATIGSGFSMKRGGLVVNEDATLNMYGADIEVHKGGMDGMIGYAPGWVSLRGEVFISGAHFHLEDGSGTWGGVQVTGPDAAGSSLANVLVEHATFGISLNNTNGIFLNYIEIDQPAFDGI